MALETNLDEERKEKGKRKSLPAAGGLEARVDWPAFLFSRVG
jgi:hypothetical protein